MSEQLMFLTPTGRISPCPHREKCGAYKSEDGVRPDGTTYTRGCDGYCYWCGMFDNRKEDKT